MRIGEAAEKTGLSISNIRFYERKGLLRPDRETESKYRDYSEADILQLKKIILYRKMDLSVEVIADLLHGKESLSSVLSEQHQILLEKQEVLKETIGLCEQVMNEQPLEEEEIDHCLAYVREKESKGKRFAMTEEIFLDYAHLMRYDYFMGHYFDGKSQEWFGVSTLMRLLWSIICLTTPVLVLFLLCMESGISIFKFAVCILLMYGMWAPMIWTIYRKKNVY